MFEVINNNLNEFQNLIVSSGADNWSQIRNVHDVMNMYPLNRLILIIKLNLFLFSV